MSPENLKTYRWSGTDFHGHALKGTITARNSTSALAQLKARDSIPLMIEEIKPHCLFKNSKKIKKSDITLFFRQLATLINAGMPIVQALSTLAQQKNKALRTLIQQCREKIESGQSLSETLKEDPHYFDSFTCAIIATGEATGRLDETLERLASILENKQHLLSKIIGALFYPMLTLGTALIISLSLLIFIVPQFKQLFQNAGEQLPCFTRLVIQCSEALQQYGWILLFLLVVFILTLKRLKKHARFYLALERCIFRCPILGPFIKKSLLVTLTRTLADTLRSGIPILDAIRLTEAAIPSACFKLALSELYKAVQGGQGIAQSLPESLFSAMAIQMIAVGEHTGNLEALLLKLCTTYERELDRNIDTLHRLLEPALMIVLGLVIGSLVAAMYLPIFKLGSIL